MQSGWEIVSTKSCFKDKNVEVVQEEIRSPEMDKPRSWTVVLRKRAVVIAAMTADDKMILIRQERIPIREAIWEVPAGQIDDESESEPDEIAAVALKELREETGFELAEGGDLVALGDYFTSLARSVSLPQGIPGTRRNRSWNAARSAPPNSAT